MLNEIFRLVDPAREAMAQARCCLLASVVLFHSAKCPSGGSPALLRPKAEWS